ncbi:MAG: hypothetical protein O2782_11200, partial [bacterium]|nr:hypothetical protein [bacterium]
MKRIPLCLSGGADATYENWPITQGIPFAEGELPLDTPVRVVDATGRPLPTQAQSLTTWDAEQHSVRWLLVDFQTTVAATVAATDGAGLVLEYGADAVSPTPLHPVRIDRDRTSLTIDTGALQARITPKALLTDVRVRDGEGWKRLWADGDGLRLTMVDGHGQLFASGHLPATIAVEEQGPLRSSIWVRGHLATAQGLRFCPYILRLHFAAGRPEIRLQHTFVFDQDPDLVELAGIGVHLPPAGEPTRAVVGGVHGVHESAGDLSFLQRDDEHYEVSGDAGATTGTRTRGWASLSSSDGGGVLAVIRDAWQEYPKGFVVDATGLDVQIWPGSVPPLAFTTPFRETALRFGGTRDEAEVVRLLQQNPTAPLNLKSFDVQDPESLLWVEAMVAKHAPERAASHNDTGIDNGRGAAKTTNILLRFAAGSIEDEEAESLAAAFQQPLLAPAAPAYACATGAFGHFHHAGEPQYELIDRGLDEIFDSVALAPQVRGRLYGMMRYGNAVCSHSAGPAVAWVHYKDTDPVRALRHVGPYNNETNDQILGAWGHYLRTGDRSAFRFASAYARCVADVCIIHAHDDPKRVGLMHYHNAHQWTGGPSPSHTMVGGILLDYYLTGDRRQLEVAVAAADWVVRTQEPAGILSCRDAALHREFTGPLTILLDVYQATWHEQYGMLAERSLHWFLQALPKPGYYPVSLYTRGPRGDEAVVEPETPPVGHARDMYPIFAAGLRLFPSERLRQHVLAEAQYLLWEHLTDNFVTADMARTLLTDRSRLWPVNDEFYWTQWGVSGDFGAQVMALAYDMTHDPMYAAYCQQHLQGTFVRQTERCRHFADWRFTWLCFGSYVPRLMDVVRRARERDAEALAEALQNWKAQRRQQGLPVYEGPNIDLQVERMDVNGNVLSRDPVDLPRAAPPRPREPIIHLGRL